MLSKIISKNYNNSYFKNKLVVITGANGILGSKITNLFNSFGAHLVLIDKTKVKKINPLKK